ncbi:MAG: phosphoribosyltransferase [Actinomycetota bacterium]|nr:phosphoribosyltransferase [Actinomycetota bacterium]
MFRDRREAGERLAERLSELPSLRSTPALVLGVPRGGVLVAEVVAARLRSPLDVVIPRKLGAPGNPELAVGAVAPGVRILDERIVRSIGVSAEHIEREVERQEREIARRERRYRAGLPAVEVSGRAAIVVDDGVATGSTALASLRWARAQHAARVVLAVPVAPMLTVRRLAHDADDVVVLETPDVFHAVGQFYRHFGQVEDAEVLRALGRAATVAS